MANQVDIGPRRSEHLSQTLNIKFSSKATVKMGDALYTVGYEEMRQVLLGANVAVEIQSLTDDVNAVVDDQIDQIEAAYKKEGK